MKSRPRLSSQAPGVCLPTFGLVLVFTGHWAALAWAEDPKPEASPPALVRLSSAEAQFPFEIWFRGDAQAAPRAWSLWLKQLRELSAHPLFQSLFAPRLPPLTRILIDPTLTAASGYYSKDLKKESGVDTLALAPAALSGNPTADSQLLIHELTHLVHDHARPWEESWVREGVALLAAFRFTGYRDPSILEALREPETSLVADLNLSLSDHFQKKTSLSQYGHLTQYFDYIYRLCGKDLLFEKLLISESRASGIEFMDEALRSSASAEPACESFNKSFVRFEQARFMDSPYSTDTYVMHSPIKARIQINANFRLPPYSAGAYIKPVGRSCLSDETEWAIDRCIRIRNSK